MKIIMKKIVLICSVLCSVNWHQASADDPLQVALQVIQTAAQTDPWYQNFYELITSGQIDQQAFEREILLHAYMATVQAQSRGIALTQDDEQVKTYLESCVMDMKPSDLDGTMLTRCRPSAFADVPYAPIIPSGSQDCTCIDLTVTGSAFINNLIVSGTAFFEQDVIISGSVVVDGDFTVSGTVHLHDIIIDGCIQGNLCVTHTLFAHSVVVTGTDTLVVEGDAYINQDLHVHQLFYLDSATVAPNNVLYVQKSIITAPNQFNSVNAALAAISGTSPSNSFQIVVSPGIYVEPTLVMKSYVSLKGANAGVTFLMSSSPNQDLIVGAPFASVRNLTMFGPIGAGFANVTHTLSGTFLVLDCSFSSSDILFKMINAQPDSFMGVGRSLIVPLAQFRYGGYVSNPLAPTSGVFVNGAFFGTNTNLLLQSFFFCEGVGSFFLGSSMDLGVLTTLAPTGTGLTVQDGGIARVLNSDFGNFYTAFNMPALGLNAPTLLLQGVLGQDNVEDLRIDHPLAEGSANAQMNKQKIFINTSANYPIFIVDLFTNAIVMQGEIDWGQRYNQVTNISPLLNSGWNTGVIDGGILSDGGGLTVEATGGLGYLMIGMPPTDYVQSITWASQSIVLPPNQDNFLYIDFNGVLQSALSQPGNETTIFLGKARTTNASILYIQEFATDARHTAQRLTVSMEDGLASIYVSGSLTTTSTVSSVELDVSSGHYVFGTHGYMPSGGSPISFSTWSLNGSGGYQIVVDSTTIVDIANWDDGSGTLQPIPPGQFARQLLYISGDGPYETYLFQYGQTLYPSAAAAIDGTIPGMPGTWSGNIARLASLIVDGSAIVQIIDERPIPSTRATSLTGVTIHGNLAGLLADDHPQYLLVNGMRAMSGSLDMGTNNIINVGLVDGVDVPAHAPRHYPIGGADPLPVAAPVTISTTNSIGIQNSFALSDHIHAHGNQPGGTLHAVVTTISDGFMSAADKTALDSLVTTTNQFVLKSGDTMTGDLIHANGTGDVYNGSTSGSVTITAPAVVTSYSVQLPTAQGAASSVLTNNGSGALSWTSPILNTQRLYAQRITTNQTISAANVTIIFNDNTAIPNVNYNTATGVYTVPTTGTYLVMVYVSASGGGSSTLGLNFGVSGAPIANTASAVVSTMGGANTTFVSLVGLVQLTSGNAFSILASKVGGGVNPAIVAGQAALSIQFIG